MRLGFGSGITLRVRVRVRHYGEGEGEGQVLRTAEFEVSRGPVRQVTDPKASRLFSVLVDHNLRVGAGLGKGWLGEG